MDVLKVCQIGDQWKGDGNRILLVLDGSHPVHGAE